MSLDLKFGPEVEQILLRTGIQLRKANKATAFFLPVCQGSRARLRCALCSAGCTEDRSLQIRWEHSTEEFNQQLQDLTHGVPGIRDHSGIQLTKKSDNGYFTSKTAPGRTGITESQERDAPGRVILENLEHRKSRQRRRRQWSWPAR